MNKGTIITICVILGIVVLGIIVHPYVYGNKEIIEFKNNFNYAILQWSDGEEVIPISSWADYENSDQIQFTTTEGITYLVHSSDVFLVSDLK